MRKSMRKKKKKPTLGLSLRINSRKTKLTPNATTNENTNWVVITIALSSGTFISFNREVKKTELSICFSINVIQ